MNGIIIYSEEGYEKNKEFVRRCERGLAAYGCRLSLVLTKDLQKDIYSYLCEGTGRIPDFAIVRAIAPGLSRRLEELGIKVFNSSKVSFIANDKARTKEFAEKCGLRTAGFIRTDTFPSKELLENVFSGKDIIVKTLNGHGGSEVYLIGRQNLSRNYENVIGRLDKNDLLKPYIIEERINGPARDMRVYIIGSKPVCAVLRSNPDDYRSNFSLGGNVVLSDIPEIVLDMTKLLTDRIYMDYTGIDFIPDENDEYYFNEIEDCAGARMLYSCSDIDIIDMFIAHIVDKVLPEKL